MTGALVGLALTAGATALARPSHDSTGQRAGTGGRGVPGLGATLTITSHATGRPVAPGFLGLSLEFWALENYAGKDPQALDPVLVKLIRNLTGGQSTVLRIGGVTTDRTWWPVTGLYRPPGAFYTLTRRRLEVAKALAEAINARLILGVQFEADSTTEAAAESRAMVRFVGRKLIEGLELGNEPELYAYRWFYKVGGNDVYGRPAGWDFQSYVSDYQHIAAAMGKVPLAGPAIGTYSWMSHLDQYLAAEHVSLVTLHRYPMQACGVGPGAPNYPTIAHLLEPLASRGLAAQFAPYVALVHDHHLLVRNAEMNSVSCGDAHGIANTFASALWALDALFEMARIGVDGVNIHTYTGAADELFSVSHHHRRWRAQVAPEYYGLLMFGQAAPAGARLLRVSESGVPSTLHTWATRQPGGGPIRVVMINDALRGSARVALRIPAAGPGSSGSGGASGGSSATIERLAGPSASATSGVTIGGRTFGANTASGSLRTLQTSVVNASPEGSFNVRIPAASAALITVQ